jgi:hypothetical protein
MFERALAPVELLPHSFQITGVPQWDEKLAGLKAFATPYGAGRIPSNSWIVPKTDVKTRCSPAVIF